MIRERHEDALPDGLMRVIDELFRLPSFAGLTLGGGTSLALRFGHRISLDADFFSDALFCVESCLNEIRREFPDTVLVNRTKGSSSLVVQNTKVDLLHHPYPLLGTNEVFRHWRLLSLADLAAMKVNAVTNRGSKKDFSDLLLLHEQGLSLETAVNHFCAKYGSEGRFHAIRSLAWFEDAETEPDPVFLNGWDWEYVRAEIGKRIESLIRE